MMATTPAQHWLVAAITAERRPRQLNRLDAPGLPARLGLDIYRNAYRIRLHECLVDDFPALHGLLGAEAFARLTATVIAQHPPHATTLNAYGSALVRVLRATPRATIIGRLACDLAQLEWALVEALHAPLAAVWDPSALTSLAGDDLASLRLLPAPSLRLVASAWAIDDCLTQAMSGAPVTRPARRAEVVAVLRTSEGMRRHRFDRGTGRLITALMRGRPLAAALATAGLTPAGVQTAFATLTAAGCFAGAVTTGTPHAA